MNKDEDLKKYILTQFKENKIEEKTALTILEMIRDQKKQPSQENSIAIVGMDCRLPDAENVEEFWKNLMENKNSINLFPESRRKDINPFLPDDMVHTPEDFYTCGGFLREIDKFDGDFFRISPREAVLMEPCQRLVLESAYRALEDGNILRAEGKNKSVGVYVGLDSTDMLQYSQMVEAVGASDILSITGSLTSIIAGRISYALGLHGPAMVIDTACSSGLVAVIEACKALNNNDCSIALAGGCNIMLTPLKENAILEIESTSKEVRAFDKEAGGTIFSEGVCFIALKRLDEAIRDKDAIYGVINAGAVNNDGASSGLTAPNPDAQVMLYQKTWDDSGINPESISYIEAHGTGTVIGDSIELESIVTAFRKYTKKTGFCGVGSVKSNIGHTKGAAGIASLIKVVMSLQNRIIPASINFEAHNPQVKLDESPVYINNCQKKWELAYPLRAGVSSFGFSGTNAHLVVEEFKKTPDTAAFHDDLVLFTLTAKSELSLKALICSYIEFLDKKQNSSLEEICYTANVCRPHFAYRIIMIVKSIADLREKLAVVASKLTAFKELNIYYGICPKKPKVQEKGTRYFENEKLTKILKMGVEEKKVVFDSICEHYIQGDLILWRNLYPEKMQKVHLPGYTFEKKRVWIDTRGYKKVEIKQSRLYPLVDELLINTHDQAIYKTRLSVSTHWPIAEHKIFERYVLPGTTLIDMITCVGVSQWGENNFYLKDLLFLKTIILDEKELLDLFIVLNKSFGKMEFQIISKQDTESPDFKLHMKGMLVFSSLESSKTPQDLTIKNTLKESPVSYQFDNAKKDGDLVLGPRWHVNGTVYQGKDELLADIEIPQEYQAELKDYKLYPSLMDVAMNYVVGVLGDDIYVPFSIKELHIYGEMSSKIKSHVTRVDRDEHSNEIIYVNIALANDQGEVFAFLQHYALKKLRSENLGALGEGFFKKFFYRTRWIPMEVSAIDSWDLSIEKTLFIRNNDSFSVDLVKDCKRSNAIVTEAVLGDSSFDCDANNVIYFNGSSEDYMRLLEYIKYNKVTKIVHMTTLLLEERTGIHTGLEEFKAGLNQGLVNLYHLVQSLINARVGWQVELVLLTNNASCVTGEENIVYPLNGSYIGTAGVIARENNNILCRAIDIDLSVQKEKIINHIFSKSEKLRVALRGDKVFVPEITNKFDDLHGDNKAVSLKQDGVYLITGGMGGIGKEVIKYLSKCTNASLIITGRTIFSNSVQDAKSDEYKRHIEFLTQLRTKGNSIEYFSVDVSDYEEMKKCITYIKDKYGKLNGVFHCAGIPGDKFLYNKSIDEFLEIISPKVLGTYIIDYLTKGWDLDFILLFSSLTTILVPPGQMDYVAANSYLNSYAEEACIQGRNIKNILWPAWKDVGMAFRANYELNDGLNFGFLKAISAENALKAMEKVLDSNIQDAIICELDFSHEYQNDLNPYGFSIDKELEDRFNRKQNEEVTNSENRNSVSLTGKDIFTSTEQLVGEIWGKVLGLTMLDVMADFHQLGGDSIHSIQIANEINKSLHLQLDIIHIFDYPSISELSNFLDSSLANSLEGVENKAISQKICKYNLSEVQLRIWFIQKMFPYVTVYNLPMIIKLDFFVEPVMIEKTINVIIKRHSVFRTVFEEKDNGVHQVILDNYNIALEVINFSNWDKRLEAVEKEIYSENNNPFDFSKPLIVAKIYRLKKDLQYLYINIHHLICDGWSSKLIYKELMSIFKDIVAERQVDSSEMTPRYVDWIEAMEEWKKSEDYLKQKEYWENELCGLLPVIDLPLDYKRPEKFSYKGDSLVFHLNNELCQKIKNISILLNYTGNIMMQTFFFLFLNRITEDEDIILGIPAAGRDNFSYEKVIGVFINTLCIRLKWSEVNTLNELFEEVKNKNHCALRNGRMPFADLIELINPERDLSRNPIFSVFFQYYDNIPPINEGTSQFDLSLYCKDEIDGMYCRFEYNSDLFCKETIQKFSRFFEGIVNTVLDFLDGNVLRNDKKTVSEKAENSLTDIYLLLEKEVEDERLKIRNQEKYWKNKLAGEWPDLNLPYDYCLTNVREYDWDTKCLEVDESLIYKIKNICERENTSIPLFILTVYIIVLSKYSKQDEIMVGTVFDDFPANILPLRIYLDNHSNFSVILREVKKLIDRERLYGEYPFEKMMDISDQEQNRKSFFDVLFVYNEDKKSNMDYISTKSGNPCPGNPDIVFVCENNGTKLQLEIRYCTELFKEITMKQIGGHILLGLKQFSLDFDQNAWTSNFITADETAWIANVINNTSAPYAEDKTLVNLFQAQVEKSPENTALVFEEKKLTYLELNEKANKLAHYLKENGIGPGKVAGVMLERSLEMVIAILGILKSGGCYLPIDVNTPRERIDYILGHAGADVLLVSENTERGNSGLYKEIRIDSQAIIERSKDNLPVQITSANLAYIIYTSGSTGKPKGVMVSHKNANNFLNWAIKSFSFNEMDRLMLVTAISFDISVLEIFGALLAGAELHIISRELLYNPSEFGNYCRKNKITVWHSVPSLMVQYLSNFDDEHKKAFGIGSLRHVILGGEAWSIDLLRKIRKIFENVQITNMYGPTETTIWVSSYCVDEQELGDTTIIPIGKPIFNNKVYILDEAGKLCGIGIPGEIYINGDNVTQGYFKNDEKTRENFILHPQYGNLYRTGDLGKYSSKETILFMGRKDNQVKVRGYRIELGEIESVLTESNEIKQAAVIIRKDGETNRLVCYYEAKEKLAIETLRERLAKKLPEYMLPSQFVHLTQMPLTPNGKIDRNALDQIELSQDTFMGNEFVEPVSKNEKILASIWSSILDVNKIGIKDNFFALGGNSIRAIQVINLIKEKFDYSVDIADIFQHPTIEHFAHYMEKINPVLAASNNNMFTLTQKLDISSKVPVNTDSFSNKVYRLSSTQKSMWFLQKYDPQVTVYNLNLLWPVDYELDSELINKAVDALTIRHTALRTMFIETNGIPRQIILDNAETDIQIIDLPDNKEVEVLLEQIIEEENKKQFNLSKVPVRFRIMKQGKMKSYIYISIHHIIADGWSIEILIKDLMKIYESYINGIEVDMKPQLPIYADWAEMQNEWLESAEAKTMRDYWIEELTKPLPILNLPADFVRPQIQTYNGSFIKFRINSEKTKSFRMMSKRNSLTPHMLMMAAYFVLLKKITLDNDIIVGFPIAGRNDRQFENVIGLFINTLCLRINFKEVKTTNELLNLIKEKCVHAYRNSKYPFDMVVSKVNPERDLSRSPIFSAMYQFYDNIPIEKDGYSQYEIGLLCRDLDDQIEVRIEYNSDLFKRETIEYFSQYFCSIVDELLLNQDKELSSIQLMSECDKALLIKQFSGKKELVRNDTIFELFEEQVKKNPESIALIFEHTNVTYKELNKRANQIANLLRKQGVLPDTPVGIMTGRGINTITGIIGILKAGGTYIPIDPGYPVARINYMICHSDMSILLTEMQQLENVSKLLEEENNLETLFILNGRIAEKLEKIKRVYTEEDVVEQSTENLPPVNTGNNLMYIIYTSGSTGLPKGVMVTHSNAVNYINWSIKDSKISSADKMMLVTSVSFDISVFEIFGALLSGASLYIVSEERISNTELLIESIKKEKLTIWHSVPTLIRQVLMIQKQEKDCEEDFSGIRRVMIGGEAWSVELAKSIRENFTNAEVINMYGPTEATIWVTSYKINDEIDKMPRIPIGKPIDNNKILILDDNMKLCPVGVEGDIYISGANVTPGYYRDEEKTAEAFSNFDETGERIYKTGDKGRYLSDENVDYLGRNDGMIKVRGYRIEIGEIESVILEYDWIKEVAVIGKKAEESSRLVCFYVSDEEQPIDRIRKHIQSKLPEYMIPSQFIHLEHMPLTPNGKIDRKTLSCMEITERPLLEHEYIRPVTEIETFLADIWQSLLNTELVGVYDNFFAIGGDSFLANRMYARIEEKYQGDVTIVDIFTYPTIAKLSEYIQGKNVTDGIESSQSIAKEMESLLSDMEKGEIDLDEAVRKIRKMN